MRRNLANGLLLSAAMLLLGQASQVRAETRLEAISTLPRLSLASAPFAGDLEQNDLLPMLKKPPSDPFEEEQEYRYDFEERHLTLGVNLGGGLANGVTMNAFPVGGTVTPYFRGAFGDGNALQFDLTVGFNTLIATEAEWLYFRTPILGGSQAWGFVGFLAPSLAFRYELELTPSISRRATFVAWGGMGLGALITYGQAELTNNGGLPDTILSNQQIFFDVVPTIGMKVRLTEFAFLEVGTRVHLMWQVASKLTNDDQFVFGTPEVIQEFWIGNTRYFDVFLGFGYDFG